MTEGGLCWTLEESAWLVSLLFAFMFSLSPLLFPGKEGELSVVGSWCVLLFHQVCRLKLGVSALASGHLWFHSSFCGSIRLTLLAEDWVLVLVWLLSPFVFDTMVVSMGSQVCS